MMELLRASGPCGINASLSDKGEMAVAGDETPHQTPPGLLRLSVREPFLCLWAHSALPRVE